MGTSEGAKKGWTEESRAKRAEAMRRKWADPEYRARRAVTEATPETKARRSAAAKEANNRPGRAEHQAEVIREKFATDPEYRKKHAASLRRVMEDPEQRLVRSESMKRAWAEARGNLLSSISALRRCWESDEWRQRRSEALKQRWTDDPAPFLRGIASRPPTMIELIVQNSLDVLGITYEANKIIDRWQLDIYVPDAQLDIEVDGVYWHGVEWRVKHDARRDDALNATGIRVLRVSDTEIEDGSYVNKLIDALTQS